MRTNRFRSLVPGLGALASAFVLSAYALPVSAVTPLADPPAERSAPARGFLTDHVVVISIDGLRPDAIARYKAENLQKLMREGSYTLQAQTILPSITLPSHTSMLTGVGPEDHGITWNSDQVATRGLVKVPTIFGMARERGFHTAAFFSKTKFHHLEVPGTLDHSDSPDGSFSWSGGRTVANVERYLEAGNRPNLMFVHLPNPDHAGHRFGWMGWLYGRAVKRADDAVESVLEAADRAFGAGNYTVIVTADHGGSGHNHGSDHADDVTIPWIAWGRGVEAGARLPYLVRTFDTAATALWLLGVSLPEGADGTPVVHAFGR